VTVHVKAGQQAVGAGKAQKDGSFHLDKPVPAYAIAFTTGKLTDMHTAVVDGYEARSVGLGSEIPAETRKAMRENTAAAMAFFSKKLGAYRFGTTMNIVEIKSTYGGMEHAGNIAIGVGQSKADTIEACVHETAHHWFGDGLRIKHWGELWMSEGFTNYMTWRFFGHRSVQEGGGDDAMFRYFDDAKDELRGQLEHGIAQPLDEPRDTDPEEGLSWVPYMQGAWMLRMLECQIGTDKLDGLLRAWFQTEKGDAVSTQDFIKFARKEGIETEPSIEAFFKAWADLKHIPGFKDKSKLDGNTATLFLEKKHADQPAMKVPVLLEGAHGEKKMALVTPGDKLVVDAGFAVKSLTWDPNRTLLCDVE
jgi:aminopeptidase N